MAGGERSSQVEVHRLVSREAWPGGIGIVMPARIGLDELRELTSQGAQLVEVLPAGDYAWAHLPGAVNHPLQELTPGLGSWTGPGRSSCSATTGIET
jgi:hypothetical protein